MRIIRLKLADDVKRLLKQIAYEGAIDDPGFVEDIFALMRLKGSGLPDKDRIKVMADAIGAKMNRPPIGINLLMTKRKMILEKLIQLPYFMALFAQDDLIASTRRLVMTFRTFYKKVREAQCVTCHLKTTCAFGMQYGQAAQMITKVLDVNYDRKVHVDCPVRPEISAANQFWASVNQLAAVTKAGPVQSVVDRVDGITSKVEDVLNANGTVPDVRMDEDTLSDVDNCDPDHGDLDDYVPAAALLGDGPGSPGMGIGFRTSFTGNHVCKVTEDFVEQVTREQLAIFELGMRFDVALSSAEALNFKPVEHMADDQEPTNIKSLSDLARLAASQHALPDEVFDAKLEKKELVVANYKEPDEKKKKKLLYLLIDSSGSMALQLGNGSFGLFTRASLASVMALSLARKARDEGGIIYCRFFEGSAGSRHKAETKAEFASLMQFIGKNDYDGSSTNVQSALNAACRDIRAAKSKTTLAMSDILLITDCEDQLSSDAVKQAMLGLDGELNVIDVAGSTTGKSLALVEAANNYYKVNETVPDVSKLVETVSSKPKPAPTTV